MKQIIWSRQIQDLSIPNGKITDTTLEFGKLNTNMYTTDLAVSATVTELARADAIKSYVDGLVDGSLKTPEAYNPTTTGNYPLTYSGATIQAGDSFRITAAQASIGWGSRDVNVEDLLIALVDWAGATTDADWMVAESNRDQATETALGLAELATQAETDAGTDDLRIVTPLKLTTFIANLNIDKTAGAGMTETTGTFNVIAADLSLNIAADNMQVNIGNTNGTSLEVSATGLELASNITGERTFTVGTWNNFDIIADANLATLSSQPTGTVPLAIATVDYVDNNAGGTWGKEIHTLTAWEVTAGAFTMSQTAIANSMDFIFNGSVQTEWAWNEYTVSGTTVTLVTPADRTAGDVIVLKYQY